MRNSKRQRPTASDRKIAQLTDECNRFSDLCRDLRVQADVQRTDIANMGRDLRAMAHQRDNYKESAEKSGVHVVVLLSDRDRLTAALEVLTRRFASPHAEQDPSRAGWRASARVPKGAPASLTTGEEPSQS